VVKNLVEMHAGTVDVHSGGVGKGSVFRFSLPTVVGPQSQSQKLLPTAEFPDLTILVVDDNRSAIFMLTRLLAKLGNHRLLTAHDGAAALLMVGSQRPDLVLLDIGLPNIDGLEVARRIRQLPDFARIRLVALTGYGSEEDRRKSLMAGFDEHLVKPPSIDMLRKVLANVLP
jgi:CheY-like chemotaxis protein